MDTDIPNSTVDGHGGDDELEEVAHVTVSGMWEEALGEFALFATVSTSEVLEELERNVERASEILGIPQDAAFLVLRHYNWTLDDSTLENYINCQGAINNQLEITQYMTGAEAVDEEDNPPVVRNTEPFVCLVCEENVNVGDGVAIARCRHFFCVDCLQRNLVYTVNRSQNLLDKRCPRRGCSNLVRMRVFEALLPPQELRRAQQRFLTEYLDNHPNMRCCPNESPCDGIIRVTVPRRSGPDVCCAKCNLQFCFKCTRKPHAPATCQMLEQWKKLIEKYDPSSVYIRSNTKECPNCHVPIEKDKGCNHMTCTRCRYEYCWVCLGPWTEHTNMYYNCQRGEAGEACAEKIFFGFYTGWANHKARLDLEQQSLQKSLDEARKLAQMPEGGERFNRALTVLQETRRILPTCRTMLMNAYISLFFSKSKDTTFHYRVRQLELCTDEISELIDVKLRFPDTDKIQQHVAQIAHWCNVLRTEEMA